MSANLDQPPDIQPDILADNDWLLNEDAPPDLSPLPADTVQESDAETSEGQQGAEVKEPDDKPEVKADEPENTLDADPELSEDENELVNAMPEAARPEASAKLKSAKFKEHFLNQSGSETLAYLEKTSASRTGELKDAVVSSFLADPPAVLKGLAEKDPETADRFVQSVYAGDENYFARKVAGRDEDATVTPEYVRTAVEFYEQFKDNIPSAKPFELSESLESDIRLALDDDEAESVINRLKQDGNSPQVAELLDKVKRLEAGEQTKAETARIEAEATLKKEQDETWDAGYSEIEKYVISKAEKQYKFVPTEDERKHTPLIARLKDTQRKLFLFGDGEEMSDFEVGFGKWGKDREGFQPTLDRWKHFSDKRERENVVETARTLIRPADKYADERVKSQAIKDLDEIIRIVAAHYNHKTPDPEIHGTNGVGSQATSESVNEWAMNLT